MTTSSHNNLAINVKTKFARGTFSHDIPFNMKPTSWIELFIFSVLLSTSNAHTDGGLLAKTFINENVEAVDSYYEYLTTLGLNKLCSFMRATRIGSILDTIGPFTLFAPTDNAFDLIPLEFLKVIQNNEMLLQEFLLGHILNNFVSLHGIANEAILPCINGAPVRFNVYREGEIRTISGAQVIQPGERYGNMLVYIVDRVVYPISGINIFNYTQENYSHFYDLLNLAEISLLPGRTYTLFAPLSQSFESLPKAALNLLYENTTLLKDVLLNHLVENTYFTAGLIEATSVLKTVGGNSLTATSRRGLILVNGVPIVKPDIHLSNGVLHGISRIILPHRFLEICKCIPIPTNVRQPAILTSHQKYVLPRRLAVSDKTVPQILPRYGVRIGPVPSGFLFISPPANGSSITTISPKKTVLQVIQTPLLITGHRTATLTTAADLFKRAGLLDTLTKTNPLTTILPTDEAFSNLPNGILEQLKNDTQKLKELLLCHMIAQNTLPAELQNNIQLPTYGGVSLNVKIVRRKLVLIGGCQVVAVSRVATGIVYIVDRVLYPKPVQTLLTALDAQPLASKFLELALKAKLDVLLTGPSFSTCFVPTNRALSFIPNKILQKLLTDPYFLKAFILRHCMSGLHFSKEFTDYLTLISHLREDLKFEINPDGIYVNGARIVLPDISAGNGVVHLVDSILKSVQNSEDIFSELLEEPMTTRCTKEVKETTPLSITEAETIEVVTVEEQTTQVATTEEQMTEIATTEEQTTEVATTEEQTTEEQMTEQATTILTTESNAETTTELTTPMPSLLEAVQGKGIDTFIHWLNQSGYLDTIQDGGEYTIFVPTDDAINTLPPTLRSVIEKQARKLKKTLKHHIVPSSLDLDQLPDETTLPTLLPGKDIRINKYDNLTTASGAPTGKHIKVGNIQFVTIDRVLEPPTTDLLAAVSKSSLLKKISKLINVAGLEDELKNGGPYTFYAPSKKAFKKMPPEEYNRLLTDPSAAKEFVLRHLVRGAQYTSGMSDGKIAVTENGNLLDFSNQNHPMTINDANINFSDINATNGVLHIIDNVL